MTAPGRRRAAPITIRQTAASDIPGVIALCEAVYPRQKPWQTTQLQSHLSVFAEGQLVAVVEATQHVVGMAASLVLTWEDYELAASWRDITARGTFANHDPTGRTLYGAEVMVHPEMQRRRIGKRLYAARRDIARRLRMKRIRAGARLRGYHRHAGRMGPDEYVIRILRGELKDPTLSFQLREGFRVFKVVADYLANDRESLGYAALIEWLNPETAATSDSARRDPRFDLPYPPPRPDAR